MVELRPLFEFLTGKPNARSAGSAYMKEWLKTELEKAFEDASPSDQILPAPVSAAAPSPDRDESAPSSSSRSFPPQLPPGHKNFPVP